MAVVMLSTELDEHVELMDRVLVFREHELEAEIPRDALSRQALVGAFFHRNGDRPHADSSPGPAAAEERRSTRRPIGSALVNVLRKYSFGVALVLTLGLLVANLLTQEGGFGWESQLANLAPLALAAMASTPSIISGG